jgi:hypothetical protein
VKCQVLSRAGRAGSLPRPLTSNFRRNAGCRRPIVPNKANLTGWGTARRAGISHQSTILLFHHPIRCRSWQTKPIHPAVRASGVQTNPIWRPGREEGCRREQTKPNLGDPGYLGNGAEVCCTNKPNLGRPGVGSAGQFGGTKPIPAVGWRCQGRNVSNKAKLGSPGVSGGQDSGRRADASNKPNSRRDQLGQGLGHEGPLCEKKPIHPPHARKWARDRDRQVPPGSHCAKKANSRRRRPGQSCETNPICPVEPGGAGLQGRGTRGSCAKRSQF